MEKAESLHLTMEVPHILPNPVRCKEGRGERNFDCKNYDACLNKAARNMWSGFSCENCVLYC